MINCTMIVKDRPRLTQQAIETLIGNTRVPLTLTIVDDASGAETREVLASIASPAISVIQLDEPCGIVGKVRNLSVRESARIYGRGELLYLSDNDAHFTDHWLEKLLAMWPIAVSKGFRVLGGYTHPYHQPIERIQTLPGMELLEHDAVGGLSMLMSWRTWDNYGPLREGAQGVCQSEDWEFGQRVRKDGWKLGVLWPHVVWNCGLTGCDGKPAVGHEAMERHEGVVME